MNKRFIGGVAALTLAAITQTALAGNDGYYDGDSYGRRDRDYRRDADYARVVDVQPLVERVRYSVPVQQCSREDRYSQPASVQANRAGATLFGGAAGAIVGHQFGRGDGRTAATLGGALLGAVIGNNLVRNHEARGYDAPQLREVEYCRTTYEDRYNEQIRGYRVTYVYNGRTQVTELPYDPGPRLKVAVLVQPLG